MSEKYTPEQQSLDENHLEIEQVNDLLRNGLTPDNPRPLTKEERDLLEQAEFVGSSKSADGQPFEIPAKSAAILPGLGGIDSFTDKGQIKRHKDWPHIRKLAKSQEEPDTITGLATIYTQPNGIVLTELTNGAHRALAAMISPHRDTVQLHGDISVYKLEHDIIPAPTAEQTEPSRGRLRRFGAAITDRLVR